jgi:integrase
VPSTTVKLSETIIKKAQPESERYELSDTETPGLKLRVSPTGVKSFVLMYRNKDLKRCRYTIGKLGQVTLTQARKIAGNKLAHIELGEDPQQQKREARQRAQTPTLREFVDGDYAKYQRAQFKAAAKTLNHLHMVCEEFGKTRLDAITAWNFEKWRAKRTKAGRSKVTANRDLEALKSALNRAVEWKVISQNPLADVKRMHTDASAKVRFLSKAEETKLREALEARETEMRAARSRANEWRKTRGYELRPTLPAYGDHLTPMVLVSINTGLIQGELFNLHWSNVDLKTKLLTVEGSGAKSGQTRHVPLNAEAHSALKQWKEQQQNARGLVFPGKDGNPFTNVKRAWQALLLAAEVRNFRWHDLRHTFASKLVMAGVDLNTVRELLGHSDIKMTLRYAHLAPEHKADAVARLVHS